jgi:integrase
MSSPAAPATSTTAPNAAAPFDTSNLQDWVTCTSSPRPKFSGLNLSGNYEIGNVPQRGYHQVPLDGTIRIVRQLDIPHVEIVRLENAYGNQGMRPEEVASIRTQDVDLERGQLQIPFGKSKAARRTLDLTAESRSNLARRCQKKSKWVFPSDRKSGAHMVRLNGAHDTACAGTKTRPGLNFVLYDWRHTFATRMAQAGVDLATLAAILGQGSIRVVQKYVHPTAEHKKQAMLRFEQALLEVEERAFPEASKAVN